MLHFGYAKTATQDNRCCPSLRYSRYMRCTGRRCGTTRQMGVFGGCARAEGTARRGIGVKRLSTSADCVHHVRRPASTYGTRSVHPAVWPPTMRDRPDQRKWRYCELVYDLRAVPDHVNVDGVVHYHGVTVDGEYRVRGIFP